MTIKKTRRPVDEWAHAELDNVLTGAHQKKVSLHESAFLVSDPASREEVTSLIRTGVWPGMLHAFEGTELIPDPAMTKGELEITQDWKPDLSMSFTLLIRSEEDTGTKPGDDAYFCRIITNCTLNSYIIHTDFYIHFPESFDMNRLKDLLGHPKFVGNPPKLVCEAGFHNERGILSVGFEYGHGCGYPTGLNVQTMVAEFAEHVNYLRRLIRAVRLLRDDYNNESNLRRVINELVKCFQAD